LRSPLRSPHSRPWQATTTTLRRLLVWQVGAAISFRFGDPFWPKRPCFARMRNRTDFVRNAVERELQRREKFLGRKTGCIHDMAGAGLFHKT
jgi:hypothetical protein